MDATQAARNLEVIRTLMERTCQYQLLTAWAGLAAGCLAGAGALLILARRPGLRTAGTGGTAGRSASQLTGQPGWQQVTLTGNSASK